LADALVSPYAWVAAYLTPIVGSTAYLLHVLLEVAGKAL
jgi:hypothetical protein